MRTPDRWDWNDWSGPEDREPLGPNEEHLIRWGLTIALCLFLASHHPLAAVPIMLGLYLLMAAMGAALAASLNEEPVFAPHLTRWDEAAASAALGLLAWMATAIPAG